MNTIEWDKCFIEFSCKFPSWRPSRVTSGTWYKELGQGISARVFEKVVHRLMDANPSPFPPGIFEIKAMAKELTKASEDANRLRLVERNEVSTEEQERNAVAAKKAIQELTEKLGWDRVNI